MKLRITRSEIVEVANEDGATELTLDNFRDSYEGTVLDQQDEEAYTSDDKFQYTPRELCGLSIEEVVDDVTEESETDNGDDESEGCGTESEESAVVDPDEAEEHRG